MCAPQFSRTSARSFRKRCRLCAGKIDHDQSVGEVVNADRHLMVVIAIGAMDLKIAHAVGAHRPTVWPADRMAGRYASGHDVVGCAGSGGEQISLTGTPLPIHVRWEA